MKDKFLKIKIAILLLFCGRAYAQDGEALKKVLDKMIRYDTEITADKVPGFLVGAIDQDSVFCFAYGTTERDGKQPPNRRTLFEIGSATKVFTASLVTKLVAAGILSLDEKLNDCLPAAYRNPKADTLRISHLLTHTSGLPLYPLGIGESQASARNPYANYSKEDLLVFYKEYQFGDERPELSKKAKKQASRKKRKMVQTPYRYSHVGYALLEIIIEIKTKEPFETTLRRELLQPLGLEDTAIELDDAQRARLAKGYAHTGLEVQPWTYLSFAGSVGLKSDMDDLLRFVQTMMGQRTPDWTALLQGDMSPKVSTDLNEQIKAGNAWHIISNKQGYDIIGHPGATDGHRVEIHFVPKTKTAVIILANSEYHMDNLGLMLLGVLNSHWPKKP